jgi:acyl-CoA synthetase (NDP forming)
MNPSAVAVVGASSTPGKLGHTILKNIIDSGFDGPIYPVNPRGGDILGLKAYASLTGPPASPDLCVVITPAATVPDIISQCAEGGIPSAVVISGGFAETGPQGEALQQDLLERARKGNIRVLGPNCQGLNLPHRPMCASWPLVGRPGKIAIISQSGTIGAELMDRLEQDGLGFSAFLSLGNRSDLDEADLIRYFDSHPQTGAIALYLEGIRDGQRFREVVESTSKPLVVLKAGRTRAGRQAIVTHTRSLAGRHEICRAFFRQNGVLTADSIDGLYHLSRGAAYLTRPRGRRLLIMASTGGTGVLAVDRATELGFSLPPPDEASMKKLRSFLSPQAIIGNPVDFTGDATADHYRKTLEVMEGLYDYFMVIFGDPIPGAFEAVRDFSNLAVICLGGGDLLRRETELMAASGIPAFPSPEPALNCLEAMLAHGESQGSHES